MLLIREPIVVALPKGHKAARKRSGALRDFEGELFMIPSKDMFPSLHQLVASAFVQNHVPLNRYQMVEHFQTAVALTMARAGFAFLPSSAKDFVPEGVVLRPPSFSIAPLDTFALWSRGNLDPLVQRVLRILEEIRMDL
jgi:LysR family transcriptional regulator, hca operon transcriptional activator